MKKSLLQSRLSFLDYIGEIRGYSALTLKSYDEAIREALAVSEVFEEHGVTVINLMPFRLKIAGSNPKTIAKKLSAMRSFVDYLGLQKMAVELRHDDSIKVPKTLPKPITHEHILEALSKADLQERLVVTLLYTCGVRISELTHLRLEDLHSGWIRVKGKGDKERDIPLLEVGAALLEEHIASVNPQQFVFEKSGQRLSENSLRYIVTKLFKKIGIKATPHQLRHSYATVLLNNNARIADVSELLGHASMATTQIYTKLGNALKLEHYRKSHPLCKGTNDTQ